MSTTPADGRQSLREVATGLTRKVQRFTTSLLPVDPGRRGDCNRCGECCKLPFPCPFLRYDDEGLASCAVYYARPPSCRKYPRTADENMTPATCGYYFVDVTEIGRATPATEQAGG
jgi:Fe-S-cluster containining protein